MLSRWDLNVRNPIDAVFVGVDEDGSDGKAKEDESAKEGDLPDRDEPGFDYTIQHIIQGCSNKLLAPKKHLAMSAPAKTAPPVQIAWPRHPPRMTPTSRWRFRWCFDFPFWINEPHRWFRQGRWWPAGICRPTPRWRWGWRCSQTAGTSRNHLKDMVDMFWCSLITLNILRHFFPNQEFSLHPRSMALLSQPWQRFRF